MSPSEQAAFTAGIRHAASMAQIAAVTIEARSDAGTIRQLAAAAALHGLADGLKGSLTDDDKSATGADFVRDRHAAVAAGYIGDACPHCHAFKLRRTGTCMVCDGCFQTTGCS